MTSDGCGRSSGECLARWDPDTSSWRTAQGSLLTGWEEFSESLPKSGMTRNGRLYRQPPLVPDTGEIAHSWWPTPLANDHKHGTEAPRDDGGDRSYELKHLIRALFGGMSVNPRFYEELMGFPTGWTALEPSETPSSPR